MSTFVLVHGASHGGWCYGRVSPLLRAQGHDVYTPTLTGLGERSHLLHPGVSLDTHITDVVSVLEYEDLTDVVLVGHSYGGMVITGAADRSPGRVRSLVYLDGRKPTNGQSLVDTTTDVARQGVLHIKKHARTVDGVELILFPDPSSVDLFGVTDPADIAWMTARLTPHPWRTFEDRVNLSNEAMLAAIPDFHMICTPLTRDHDLMTRVAAAGRLREIDGAHDIMITDPAYVATTLEGIASAP